jgi:hypothetical protein
MPLPSKTVPAEARVSGSIDGRQALLDLAPRDLTLAAAMLDVRILPGDGGLTFDFSGASKAAETALSSARAKGVVLSAFGLVPAENPAEPPAENARPGPERFPGVSAGGRSMTAAEIVSARLDADILMSKRLDSEDTETGEIEDEQL